MELTRLFGSRGKQFALLHSTSTLHQVPFIVEADWAKLVNHPANQLRAV